MKCFLLLFFIGSYSLMLAQAPDGFPSTFTASGNGNWNTVTWTEDVPGTDPDGPDGDDLVIINGNSITVTADAGFGRLEYNATGTTQPTLTVNSGVSLTGSNAVLDGAIIVTASQIGVGLHKNKDQTFDIDGGTVSCTELDLTTTSSFANVRFNIKNGGTLSIDNDLTMASILQTLIFCWMQQQVRPIRLTWVVRLSDL